MKEYILIVLSSSPAFGSTYIQGLEIALNLSDAEYPVKVLLEGDMALALYSGSSDSEYAKQLKQLDLYDVETFSDREVCLEFVKTSPVRSLMDEAKNITKESAINSMLAQSAIYKAQKEAAEQQNQPKKLTKEEREARKKQVVDYLMYQQEEAYFVQHHYIMDGRTKRRVRAMISRNYDKGKYKPKSTDLNG